MIKRGRFLAVMVLQICLSFMAIFVGIFASRKKLDAFIKKNIPAVQQFENERKVKHGQTYNHSVRPVYPTHR
jgi:uncharacterized protein YneF (UPF0154 family)